MGRGSHLQGCFWPLGREGRWDRLSQFHSWPHTSTGRGGTGRAGSISAAPGLGQREGIEGLQRCSQPCLGCLQSGVPAAAVHTAGGSGEADMVCNLERFSWL